MFGARKPRCFSVFLFHEQSSLSLRLCTRFFAQRQIKVWFLSVFSDFKQNKAWLHQSHLKQGGRNPAFSTTFVFLSQKSWHFKSEAVAVVKQCHAESNRITPANLALWELLCFRLFTPSFHHICWRWSDIYHQSLFEASHSLPKSLWFPVACAA